MKPKYHILIFVGLVFTVITAISIWGKWGAIVALLIYFFIYTRCPITWWYIYGKKPKKENKKNKTKKYPRKMKYLDWSFENGKPVAKAIEEKEVEESQ